MKKLLNLKPRSRRSPSEYDSVLRDLWVSKVTDMVSHFEEARTRDFGVGAEAAVYVRDGRTTAGWWVGAGCTAREEFPTGRLVYGRPIAIVRVKALKP
jgi:hypothetical protein